DAKHHLIPPVFLAWPAHCTCYPGISDTDSAEHPRKTLPAPCVQCTSGSWPRLKNEKGGPHRPCPSVFRPVCIALSHKMFRLAPPDFLNRLIKGLMRGDGKHFTTGHKVILLLRVNGNKIRQGHSPDAAQKCKRKRCIEGPLRAHVVGVIWI